MKKAPLVFALRDRRIQQLSGTKRRLRFEQYVVIWKLESHHCITIVFSTHAPLLFLLLHTNLTKSLATIHGATAVTSAATNLYASNTVTLDCHTHTFSLCNWFISLVKPREQSILIWRSHKLFNTWEWSSHQCREVVGLHDQPWYPWITYTKTTCIFHKLCSTITGKFQAVFK